MPLDLDYLQSRMPGRRIEWHDRIDSTMYKAGRLAAEGCPHGLVVGAEEQTAGIGRYGRHWHSPPGAGIYMSVVLRLPFGPDKLPVVTLALGLAVVDAIQKATDMTCDIRWPNDILVQGKKCCGILTQLEGSAIIGGIGINVNQPEFPDDIAAIATSLRIAGGRNHSRERIVSELLPAIDIFCGLLASEGAEPILHMFSQTSSYVSGRRVAVDQGDAVLHGTTAGLDRLGFLLLNGDDGKLHQIIAGGVRPCS